MDIAPTVLDALRERARATLSHGRYTHTLGVERCVCRLGERLLPEAIPALRAAALLHDITKEYTPEEHRALCEAFGISLPEEALSMPALMHAFTAPLYIRRELPSLACEPILSAIACHTVGRADMTLFDKILFVADYVEDGRTYPACVAVRQHLFASLSDAAQDAQHALDEATLAALENTVSALLSRGKPISVETVMARNALLGRIYRD